ncbi:MAG TPA: UDP-N-acetylmuramoyl-L-alanine--D-glutamate ligase [Candidatus Peribacterales bacterium]|nr:UDP-N-acetylmuramoyl-L-alanine--D-glutamate ligase [Candidatus Peribacterales bacterium]
MQSALYRLAGSSEKLVVGILGFGVDGQGVAEWLSSQSEVREIVIFDDLVSDQRLATRPARWPFGRVSDKLRHGTSLNGVDLLFRSPGFPLTHPLISDAKKRGIPITSSTIEVLGGFPGITVGITGSNGKTTCTALIEEFLKAEFGTERVERGGNDGVPRLDLLSSSERISSALGRRMSESRGVFGAVSRLILRLDRFAISLRIRSRKADFLILELSSFQLIDCPYSPNIAVVLNITPNHLDWHKNMEEYAEAKRQIVAHQQSSPRARSRSDRVERLPDHNISILNPDDAIVKTFAERIESEVQWFTNDIPWSDVRVKSHPSTIRAAVTAAHALNVSEANILKILREFKGVPHRLEYVRELERITYYNDSSCTTPESAIVACNVFPTGSLILLLGGRDKKMDFTRMYEVIKERRVRIVPYGEMGPTFAKSIPPNLLIPNSDSMNFSVTITLARSAAKSGDAIVLSPACTSFDMFKNAKERGAKFVEIVRSLL